MICETLGPDDDFQSGTAQWTQHCTLMSINITKPSLDRMRIHAIRYL